ncbi:MAG: hypothetical protein R3F07_19775 [Opitutaceae bacterium]
MKISQRTDESEMVALFLRSELKSERWSNAILKVLGRLSLPTALITEADTTDTAANAQRARILGVFRGYRENRELFRAYPDGVVWHRVVLDGDDFQRLMYIDYSYWNELTGGSRRPLDAVPTILSGREVFGVSNQPAIDGARLIRSGTAFEPIILVASDPESDLVILEGHGRATAYALAGRDAYQRIPALLGLAPGFASWL